MTGIVVAFYANLQPIREDGLVRVVQTFAPLPTASEVLPCLSSAQDLACFQHMFQSLFLRIWPAHSMCPTICLVTSLLLQMLGAWLPYSKSTKSPLIEKGIVYMTDPDLGPAAVLFLDDWRYDLSSCTSDRPEHLLLYILGWHEPTLSHPARPCLFGIWLL